jgi:hypothetical protein
MSFDLINILKAHQSEKKLGAIAKEALKFIDGAVIKSWQSPGVGQSSLSVANMYKIRMKHKTQKPEAFLGLEESISSLTANDLTVHLSVIETSHGVVSVWLLDGQGPPVGIVVGKFLPSDDFQAPA